MQDIQAQLRFLPLSAQKVRLVVDMVRGKDALMLWKHYALFRSVLRSLSANCLLPRFRMQKKILVSVAMIYMSPRFLPMKLLPVAGVALAHVVVSSRFYAVHRMLLSSCASAAHNQDRKGIRRRNYGT